MRHPQLVCLALLTSPLLASATTTAYNTRAAWLAALSASPTTIDFDGIVPTGGSSDSLKATGFSQSGVTFKAAADITGLYLVDGAFFAPLYDWSSGAVLSFQNKSIGNIALPANTTAVGVDLLPVRFDAGYIYGGQVTVDLSTGDSYDVTGLQRPNHAFLGVISTSPISSLTLSTQLTSDLNIDNFSFLATPVPTPASVPTILLIAPLARSWRARRQ